MWQHEARGFTTWLERNTDVLSETLGLVIDNVERERSAGNFSVDLVGEDAAGNQVVIENQLERSDHDHLGKLITYLAAFTARTAIWIVADPRPEHVGAITWLNESVEADFYLVKVEAVRIDQSPAAPLLTLITGPSAAATEVRAQKQERAERHDLRQAFWTGLLARARPSTGLHSAVSASTSTWLVASAGQRGLLLCYIARQHDAAVALVIDRGDAAENAALFERIRHDQEAIENEFGGRLDWDPAEGKQRCQVGARVSAGGYRDPEENWPVIQDKLIDTMVRFERVLRPRIHALTLAD
ncbi:MAG: DUF4268 domain-containing protein [Solirubrobacteraceae bacterium]